MKKILIIITIILFVTGCSNNSLNNTYITISGDDAYRMMNTKEVIIIDVRSKEEYVSGHLENSINIPHVVIQDEIQNSVNDLNKTIILYCRSGARATTAANILVDLGYKNVYTFGGLDNWNYELIK